MCMCYDIHGVQKTVWKDQFSPTMWGLGVELIRLNGRCLYSLSHPANPRIPVPALKQGFAVYSSSVSVWDCKCALTYNL